MAKKRVNIVLEQSLLSRCMLCAVQDAVLRGGKALPLYGRLLEAPHLPTAIVLQVCGVLSYVLLF
jgi:hypothetical protein